MAFSPLHGSSDGTQLVWCPVDMFLNMSFSRKICVKICVAKDDHCGPAAPKSQKKGPNLKPKTPAERQFMFRARLNIELQRFDVAVRHRVRFVNGYDAAHFHCCCVGKSLVVFTKELHNEKDAYYHQEEVRKPCRSSSRAWAANSCAPSYPA